MAQLLLEAIPGGAAEVRSPLFVCCHFVLQNGHKGIGVLKSVVPAHVRGQQCKLLSACKEEVGI